MRHGAAKLPNLISVVTACILLLSAAAGLRAQTPAKLRAEARQQFERAEAARSTIEQRAESGRTLKEYASLARAYRKVYLITPHAAEVPDALYQVAVQYTAMGDLFDEKYYQMAVDAYQFLLQEYPTNRYRQDGLLAIAKIELEDLRDPQLARQTYEQFLALYPRSAKAKDVRTALNKLGDAPENGAIAPLAPAASSAANKTAEPTVPEAPQPEAAPSRAETAAASAAGSEVSQIRTWNANSYTRILIDVGGPLKYQAARISDPDRIYFDIENATIRSDLSRNPIPVEAGGFLKTIRAAQYQPDVVRVVLEVTQAKDYSVFLLPNPYRLVVDVYGKDGAVESSAAAAAPANRAAPAPAASKTSAPSAVPIKSAARELPAPVAVAAPRNPFTPATPATAAAAPAASGAADADAPILAAGISAGTTRAARTSKATPATKSGREQARELTPPSVPSPTRDGQQSLTRALGLKIGRIVIDAGHGGHDTGTIGPSGLMEKDLSLDISLRLGKLIQQRLPGAEVVYTREDDTFVPLEQRTAFANDSKADLFLSVHANSSPDATARGIETYYLNFTASSAAMAVAARENALSANAVHDLQDIVSKIARNEKIDESREFAGSIQDSLAGRITEVNRGNRNRGVRKAPFVVLIGANMPSVLAEVSFLSNSADERWLKKPESRQRVAEGLYQGIEGYLQNTNSLTYSQNPTGASGRNAALASSGNSQ